MTDLPEDIDSGEVGMNRDETRIYRESRPGVQRHRFKAMNTLVLICAGATVALLILTFLQWLPSYLPLLLYLGLVVLPASLYVVWRGQSENMAVLRTFLAYALLLSIPFMAWNVSYYRGGVYYLLGWSLPKTTLLVAMKERSELVSVQACVHLLDDEKLIRDAIMPTLRVRAAVSAECLERVAAVDFPMANSISRALNEQWYNDLVHSNSVPAENGCMIAESVSRVAKIAELEGAPMLLHCALSSPQTQTAQCCAQVLSTQFPADSNPDVQPLLIDSHERQALFGALTRVVDQPAERLLDEGNADSAVQWPAGLLLHWTARLGCSLVESSERRDRFSGELARITATQCGLDVEKSLHTFETITLIKNTCEPFLEDAARDDSKPVTLYDWCSSARIAARSTAAEAASFVVHQSISVRNVEGLADSIELGGEQERVWETASTKAYIDRFDSIFDGQADSDTVALDRPSWANALPNAANKPVLTPAQARARRQRIEQAKKEALSGSVSPSDTVDSAAKPAVRGKKARKRR